jgi:hypothetical protein
MAFSAAIRHQCTVVDDVTIHGESHSVTQDDFNTSRTLNSTSTPLGSECYAKTIAGTGAAVTYDFTALVREFDTLDATGLKLQHIQLNNIGSGTVTITERSDPPANQYDVNGAADDIVVPTGSEFSQFYNDTLADVAAGVKNLNINGTNGQNFQLKLVFG